MIGASQFINFGVERVNMIWGNMILPCLVLSCFGLNREGMKLAPQGRQGVPVSFSGYWLLGEKEIRKHHCNHWLLLSIHSLLLWNIYSGRTLSRITRTTGWWWMLILMTHHKEEWGRGVLSWGQAMNLLMLWLEWTARGWRWGTAEGWALLFGARNWQVHHQMCCATERKGGKKLALHKGTSGTW